MERLRQSLPTCSPAACCESEALDDPLDAGILSELNYGNWMSDVANRLWNIPLVRLAQASGAHTAGGEHLVAGPGAPSVRAPSTPAHSHAPRACLRHAIHHLRAVPDTPAGEGGRRGSVAPGCAPSCALRPAAPAAVSLFGRPPAALTPHCRLSPTFPHSSGTQSAAHPPAGRTQQRRVQAAPLRASPRGRSTPRLGGLAQ